MRATFLLLSALLAFSPKACQEFCEAKGYDLCVPIRRDKGAYWCADRVQRDGIREMLWNARWQTAPHREPYRADDRVIREYY